MRRRGSTKPRASVLMRFRPIKPPRNCDPLVRRFYEIRNAQRMPIALISERSGVSDSTINSWWRSREPGIGTLNAALNTMGFRLAIVPIKSDA